MFICKFPHLTQVLKDKYYIFSLYILHISHSAKPQYLLNKTFFDGLGTWGPVIEWLA